MHIFIAALFVIAQHKKNPKYEDCLNRLWDISIMEVFVLKKEQGN